MAVSRAVVLGPENRPDFLNKWSKPRPLRLHHSYSQKYIKRTDHYIHQKEKKHS